MVEKNWETVSVNINNAAPLVSELLLGNSANIIGALLAKHIGTSSNPEDIMEVIITNDTVDLFLSITEFEDLHRKKFEAMLFSKALCDVEREEICKLKPLQGPSSYITSKVICASVAVVSIFATLIIYLHYK